VQSGEIRHFRAHFTLPTVSLGFLFGLVIGLETEAIFPPKRRPVFQRYNREDHTPVGDMELGTGSTVFHLIFHESFSLSYSVQRFLCFVFSVGLSSHCHIPFTCVPLSI
jgi:hypothetical protein